MKPGHRTDRATRAGWLAGGAGRMVIVLLALAVLAGCAGREVYQPRHSTTGTYTVQAGDTLYGIAFRQGVDYRDLAAWNRLETTAVIFPGQVLRVLAPPGYTPRAGRTADAGPAPRTSPPAASGAGRSPADSAPRPSKPRAATPPRPASSSTPSLPAASPPARARWQWPVRGPILARFGQAGSLGNGIDIGGRRGQKVLAAAAGEVVYAGSGLIGYGKLIIVKHNENYLSAYAHNEALLVEEGESVAAGQTVANMGEGPGGKPHLHFEIRFNGQPVDPLQFLPK